MHNQRLLFHEIVKLSGLRSNDVAYFLEQLVKEGVIVKFHNHYTLTGEAEKYVPFFVESSDKLSPLPVVLVAFRNGDSILLHQRTKKPYLGFWSLPGGRLRLHESLSEGAERILKEKHGVMGSYQGCNAILHERHHSDGLKHAFLLLFVSVSGCEITTSERRKMVEIEHLNELQMIPSDEWLIQNKLDDSVEIGEEILHTVNDGIIMEMQN